MRRPPSSHPILAEGVPRESTSTSVRAVTTSSCGSGSPRNPAAANAVTTMVIKAAPKRKRRLRCSRCSIRRRRSCVVGESLESMLPSVPAGCVHPSPTYVARGSAMSPSATPAGRLTRHGQRDRHAHGADRQRSLASLDTRGPTRSCPSAVRLRSINPASVSAREGLLCRHETPSSQ